MQWNDLTLSLNIEGTLSVTPVSPYAVRIDASWDKITCEKPELTFVWETPLVDIHFAWHPACGKNRSMRVDWMGDISSRITSSAPVFTFFSNTGRSRMTVALSDALTLIGQNYGVREENGMLHCRVTVPLDATGKTNSYSVMLYRDYDDQPYEDAIRRVSAWWEKDCGYVPMHVPELARLPLYSTWYSYHQQAYAADLEAECALAAEDGYKTVIVDDGWQTDDNSRGYAFCGDWEACPAKIPDMAAHVRAVHDIGMKYILWYSVPFVGYYSDHYDHFKDMLLYKRDNLNTGVLDPRYKEVREFLVNIYKKALLDWNPDGFKLDFIDSWFDSPENAPYNEKMDIPSLQDAVRIFMTTVMQELKSVKSDILLEFRQNYIGPHMRTFGNMFRVADCPGDYLSNRVGIFDLRMLMGNSAVHSDMLMWHQNETVEMDALQIISIMFGVMQYSACLHQQSSRVKKMSKFWLDFLSAHKKTLLDGKLRCYEPHLLYTWAQSTSDEECIAAVYSADKCISPKALSAVYLANGSNSNRILVEMEGVYQVSVFNCCGEETECFIRDFRGINTLDVPVGGIAVLKSDCTANVQNEKTTIPAKR